MATLNLIAIRDGAVGGESNGGFYSPAKEKAAIRGAYSSRSAFLRRFRNLFVGAAKVKVLLAFGVVFAVVMFASRVDKLMGWNLDHASSVSSSSRGGYTVLINTWKRNTLLKQSVAYYASCSGTDAIHVVWSESDPPSDRLRTYLRKLVQSKSQMTHKPNLRFDLNEEDNLNNRFKPIKDLRTDAIFSVDDDVIVPCDTLDYAFSVWQSAPSTMVGFVPRMLWSSKETCHCAIGHTVNRGSLSHNFLTLRSQGYGLSSSYPPCTLPIFIQAGYRKNGGTTYEYGGWWSVWWTGTYSMVLSKAAFFHRKYLDLYTHEMPTSIRDYVTRKRNCEDIAMSLLVANATGAPPIWVKGKIFEIGSSGISSLNGHYGKRSQCLNDFISLYGTLPLVSTNVKAVDAKREWFW